MASSKSLYDNKRSASDKKDDGEAMVHGHAKKASGADKSSEKPAGEKGNKTDSAEHPSEGNVEMSGENGTEGMHARHSEERGSANDRHGKERRDLHGNHRSEHDKMAKRHDEELNQLAEKHMQEIGQQAGAGGMPMTEGDEMAAAPAPGGAPPGGAPQAAPAPEAA